MNINFSLLIPEWCALGTLMLVLISELIKGKDIAGQNQKPISWIWIFLAFLTTFTVLPYRGIVESVTFNNMFKVDAFASFFKAFFSLTLASVLWMSRNYFKETAAKTGEYILILWCILIGLFFLASSNHFLVAFIALEIVTLSFYVLAAYLKKDASSIEAGLKYLILGSLASAFVIFGISFIYLGVGSLYFSEVALAFSANPSNPFLIVGLLLIISGIGFKIAVVPFHLWVPDVYQGAPTPVVAFLSVASKAAGFVLLIRILFDIFPEFIDQRKSLFSILAAMTILYGNLGAIAQTNIKRLFGYSSIGHAGYLLIGIAVGTRAGLTAIIYYLMAYAVTNMCAFFVICIVGRETKSDEIMSYTGLAKRSPFLAAALFISLLSLAGIPPLAGFFGKFMILLSAIHGKLSWLAFIGILGVPISLYYYLNIVRTMYFEVSIHDSEKILIGRDSKLALSLLLMGILAVGIWQAPFISLAHRAARALF